MDIKRFINEKNVEILEEDMKTIFPREIYLKYGENVLEIINEYLTADRYVIYEKDTSAYDLLKDAILKRGITKLHDIDGINIAVYADSNVGYVIDFNDEFFLHNLETYNV